ncbi:inorganic phosphate transporter [Profundibacter sp.]
MNSAGPGKANTSLPIKLVVSLAFLLITGWAVSGMTTYTGMTFFVVAAAVIGGYMAMNIGANDVANNVAAAVGSGALPVGWAIVLAMVFETSGALIAGGDVVSTISKGIIDPSMMPDTKTFVLAMGSALLAAALWLNLATWIGAPVSTTHSIVGGVVGVGIAAAGFSVVNWGVMSKIVASWFISPILGGLIAATFLMLMNKFIFNRKDMLAASRYWVPVFVGIMAAAFAMYLTMKGLKRIWKPEPWMIMAIGTAAFIAVVLFMRPLVTRAAQKMKNQRSSINRLFNIPLIFAAALLSFAHGANDVANAIGPVSAIVDAASTGEISAKVGIPLWVMLIGAVGIALGLALFGAKLIKTVGKQLTTLDQARAFSVALSAAITVIAASAIGLPVSSTHIAIGAIFGVGFYREWLTNSSRRASAHSQTDIAARSKGLLASPAPSIRPRKLVRRREFLSILAAWFITVPSAAVLASLMFFVANALIGG